MSAQMVIVDEAAVNNYSVAAGQLLWSFPIDLNSASYIRGRVSTRRVSDGAAKVFSFEIGLKRVLGSVTVFHLEIVTAAGIAADLVALAALAIDLSGAADTVQMTVFGIEGVEIEWGARMDGEIIAHVVPV